jgi:hypothetical protein
MKLIDIINSIDLNDKNLQCEPDWNNICSALDLFSNSSYFEDSRLKAYHIITWYCTDSYVGSRAYFLDNEFVAISEQTGRKYDEEFRFVSKEAADKVRNYILSMQEYREPSLLDVNEETSDYYSIGYPTQLLIQFHKYGVYKDGRKVEITSSGRRNYERVLIMGKFEGSENEEVIDVRDVKFKVGASYPDATLKAFDVDKNNQIIK